MHCVCVCAQRVVRTRQCHHIRRCRRRLRDCCAHNFHQLIRAATRTRRGLRRRVDRRRGDCCPGPGGTRHNEPQRRGFQGWYWQCAQVRHGVLSNGAGTLWRSMHCSMCAAARHAAANLERSAGVREKGKGSTSPPHPCLVAKKRTLCRAARPHRTLCCARRMRVSHTWLVCTAHCGPLQAAP